MRTLRKADLEFMQKELSVLTQEEERCVTGGSALDDFAQNMKNAGYDVNVYDDPDQVPDSIWSQASGDSGSHGESGNNGGTGNYDDNTGIYGDFSGMFGGSGTYDNPFGLSEVQITGKYPAGKQLNAYNFDSLSEFMDHAFNKAWYDSLAQSVVNSIPGIGHLTKALAKDLERNYVECMKGVSDSGKVNVPIYVSIRYHNGTGGIPEIEVKAFDLTTGELISTSRPTSTE